MPQRSAICTCTARNYPRFQPTFAISLLPPTRCRQIPPLTWPRALYAAGAGGRPLSEVTRDPWKSTRKAESHSFHTRSRWTLRRLRERWCSLGFPFWPLGIGVVRNLFRTALRLATLYIIHIAEEPTMQGAHPRLQYNFRRDLAPRASGRPQRYTACPSPLADLACVDENRRRCRVASCVDHDHSDSVVLYAATSGRQNCRK